MGLLDSLAGEALSAFGGNTGQAEASAAAQASAAHPGMMDVITGLLGNQSGGGGGLAGLIANCQNAGLGDIVNSWIGSGRNLPITGEQIQALLGSAQVQAIAQQLGLSPDAASHALAQVLPQAVDHVTPDGELPHNDLIEQGLSLFRSFSARA